ncbi:MAG: general secretion pathway protein GspK [Gammaproteobacteria bacterium]|nr:general secretion pathway protein GspK [Gammaproteobacteria bacterium]
MRQRGVALITAIVLVAIATVIAVYLGTRTALDLRRTAGLIALDQARQVALGAEAWAIEVLQDDQQESQTDHPGESWAQPIPPLPIDGGSIRGRLEDLQGRFNLNSLVAANGRVDEVSVALFERLLDQVEASPRWARIMADWIDVDTVPGFPEGAEDGDYLAQDPPYRAANGAVVTVSELLALPGMTLAEFQRIQPWVAALPAGTLINVCTAPAPVLAALVAGRTDFSDAEALARNRQAGCFPTLDDLRATLTSEEFTGLQPVIAESSNWFRLTSTVTIGTSELTLYSLIGRQAGGGGRTVLRTAGTE